MALVPLLQIDNRRNFLKRNLCFWGQSHIQQMMPKGTAPAYGQNISTLSGPQFIHGHRIVTSLSEQNVFRPLFYHRPHMVIHQSVNNHFAAPALSHQLVCFQKA